MKVFWRVLGSWMAIASAAAVGRAIAQNSALEALVYYSFTLWWYLQVYLNRTKKGEI